MRKYLELFPNGFDSSIEEKIAPENWPYVGLSLIDLKAAFTTLTLNNEGDDTSGGEPSVADNLIRFSYKREDSGASLVPNLSLLDLGANIVEIDLKIGYCTITCDGPITRFYNSDLINNGILIYGISFPSTITELHLPSSLFKTVNLPDNLEVISLQAFKECVNLKEITIPDSVTEIELEAFYNCSSLSSITFSKNLVYVSSSAFYGTAWYNSLPDGEVYIGNIFYEYHGAMPDNTLVEIKNGTSIIGEEALYGCSSLTSVTIPNSVTSIGTYAFYNCSSLTSITIPDSVTSIGAYAFHNTAWYNNLIEGVIYINNILYTYKGATDNIGSIDVQEGTTQISNRAFYSCKGLTSITIPNSVTSLGDEAFYSCKGLTSVTIGNSVTSIGEAAFYNCSSLTSVTIPNSVTSIGERAFKGCSGLKSMVVESGNTVYDSRENCNAIIKTATNTLIAGCKNTTIPNSVTSIGEEAFYDCSSLTSITIPNSVTSIGRGAFRNCSSLTSVTIPNSVTSIGMHAFYSCSQLTSIAYNGTIAQWQSITKGSSWDGGVPTTKVQCTDGETSI